MTKTTRAEVVDVLGLAEVDRTMARAVGGKGASLGELSGLAGVHVPAGFCVTTGAFRRVVAGAIGGLLDRLAALAAEDRDGIREVGGELRRVIEGLELPADLRAAIEQSVAGLGADGAYAVRSSATAEDLPGASFAGQQDTFLNVRGVAAIVTHVRRCWASLFSERAVTYRIQHGFDHRAVDMAVVVQRMVAAEAAGILFTADPVSSDRTVTSIEAGFGLGEALVAGLTRADRYRVRDGRFVERAIASKELEIRAVAEGGTEARAVAPERRGEPVLTDAQVLELADLGRRIAGRFGCPQDIEWCLAGGCLSIVQSRPITTLYPVPRAGDGGNHVFISVGHQQMMTDAMKPLGLSVFQLVAGGRMLAAGGRLFVDVTPLLASAASRGGFLDLMGSAHPLMKDAIVKILERGDFVELKEGEGETGGSRVRRIFDAPVVDDPAIAAELIARDQAAIAELKRRIAGVTGTAVFDVILDDIQRLREFMADPRSMGLIMAGVNAYAWLNERLLAWLGEKNAADALSQSAPNNITAEMGLALMGGADVIRPYPQVIAYLQAAGRDGFLNGLDGLDGGAAARAAIAGFLEKYGMRCAGEVDITRVRWSEDPTTLVPSILSNIKNFAPQAGERRFEQGRQEALRRAEGLLDRLRALPDGEQRASEARGMIDRLRNVLGYREYPKYGIVSRYYVYKQALLGEAERLVRAGVIGEVEDVFYLRFEELREVVRTQRVDGEVVRARRAEHAVDERRTPPRVITSDGEVVAGAYRREDLPAGAIVGVPVSAGVVEGRARVLVSMADAELEAGDILVTAYTDPSWTPLFVAIAGLVTEVGGLMTHGAVIAREYGLPAVVGVEQATRKIRDGQHIRVHGTDGYVEILG